jgi:hypothetical protein
MHENLRDLDKNNFLLRKQNRPPPGGDGPYELVLLFTSLLTAPFTRQSFFHALLLAWFEVKGMSFDFLDDVFLLYLPLKAAQGVFEGLSLLQSDFCQLNYTPKLVLMGRLFIARFCTQVERYCDRRPDSVVVPGFQINTSAAKQAAVDAGRRLHSLS